jgi:hypothetical protein
MWSFTECPKYEMQREKVHKRQNDKNIKELIWMLHSRYNMENSKYRAQDKSLVVLGQISDKRAIGPL